MSLDERLAETRRLIEAADKRAAEANEKRLKKLEDDKPIRKAAITAERKMVNDPTPENTDAFRAARERIHAAETETQKIQDEFEAANKERHALQSVVRLVETFRKDAEELRAKGIDPQEVIKVAHFGGEHELS